MIIEFYETYSPYLYHLPPITLFSLMQYIQYLYHCLYIMFNIMKICRTDMISCAIALINKCLPFLVLLTCKIRHVKACMKCNISDTRFRSICAFRSTFSHYIISLVFLVPDWLLPVRWHSTKYSRGGE